MFATLLISLWRCALRLADWRGHWRYLTGRPVIDVVIITNVRDEQERRLFWGSRVPASGHSNGARIYLNGVAGRIRGLYVTAEELLTKEGRQLAKQQFIRAVQWADKRGAKVVLLAASTKRLFGRDGAELRRMFPHMLFTIGDNGTTLLLFQDIARALAKAKVAPNSRVLVVGPYGILGAAVTRYLMEQKYEVLGFGTNPALLNEFATRFPIDLHDNIGAVGKVDVVVACTHSPDAKLTLEAIESLRKPQQKLLVIDVAEPANLDAPTLRQCASRVLRQDAGNARSPQISFVLGRISSSMLKLPSKGMFGCFAEAMTLYHAIYRDHQHMRLNQDWFHVNRGNMAVLEDDFALVGIEAAPPHCFGKPVTDFRLALGANPTLAHANPVARLDPPTAPLQASSN
ncbi:MAG: NAD(P)-binding domain-containing protein [Pseudomonadota bacterium]